MKELIPEFHELDFQSIESQPKTCLNSKLNNKYLKKLLIFSLSLVYIIIAVNVCKINCNTNKMPS